MYVKIACEKQDTMITDYVFLQQTRQFITELDNTGVGEAIDNIQVDN